MATRLTPRGKLLVGILAVVLLIVVGISIFADNKSSDTPKTGQAQSVPDEAQKDGIPPLSATRATELEALLSSNDPKQHAAAWAEMMRDDVAATIKDQDTYKLQLDSFNNKDVSDEKSVSGAVSATIDGVPGIISLVYVEDSTTTKPDGTWFVWKIEVN